MNITDILLEDSMHIPVCYDSKNGFTAGIIEILEKYIKTLLDYNISNTIISNIRNFKSHIESMYDLYFLGHQRKSYDNFIDSLKSLSEDLSLLFSDFNETTFYRARYNNGNHDFDKNEMFHIPFNLRGKIKTQRYSFPGLPCLYLGASSYACWLELNRPPIDEFQVARINMDAGEDTLKIMDLSILPNAQKQKLDNEDANISLDDYLLLWPIIAMCSVKVNNEDDDFKPEYIFPQFVLEFILTQDTCDNQLIGIKYASTKVANVSELQYTDDWTTYTNYVFPVRNYSVNTSNECPYLSKYFKIITNYSGKELQIITDMLRESDVQFIDIDMDKEPNNTNVCNAKLYTSDDRFLPYNKSIFFRIEKALLVKDFSTENNQLEIRTVTKEEIDRLFDDPILPELSVEMLNTAASKNGQLMKFYTLEGLNICVDSIDFTKDKSSRNIAKVENAFNELVKNSYIEPIGSKGEIFNVTEKGYRYLEKQ